MATKSKKYQPTPCLRSQFLITDFLNVSNTSITVQEVKKGCGEPIPSFAVTDLTIQVPALHPSGLLTACNIFPSLLFFIYVL